MVHLHQNAFDRDRARDEREAQQEMERLEREDWLLERQEVLEKARMEQDQTMAKRDELQRGC